MVAARRVLIVEDEHIVLEGTGSPTASATLDLDDNERKILKDLHLITAKPVMYIANVDEGGFENNPHLDAVKEYAAAEGAEVVAICAAIEAEIAPALWAAGSSTTGSSDAVAMKHSCTSRPNRLRDGEARSFAPSENT